MVWYVIHEYAVYDDPSQVQHTWKVVGRYESKGKAEKEALELSFNEYCKDKPMRFPKNLRNKTEYKLDDKITIVTNVMCSIQESSAASNQYRGIGYFIINSDDLKINKNVVNVSDIFKHLRNYSKETNEGGEEADEVEGKVEEADEAEGKVEEADEGGELDEAEGKVEEAKVNERDEVDEDENKQQEADEGGELDEVEADKGDELAEADKLEPEILEVDYENDRKQSLRYLADELEIKKEKQDDSEYETESYYETETESESESSSDSYSDSDEEADVGGESVESANSDEELNKKNKLKSKKKN